MTIAQVRALTASAISCGCCRGILMTTTDPEIGAQVMPAVSA